MGEKIYLGIKCNQPPRPTQPGHPAVCSRDEYQPMGGDDLHFAAGGKGRYDFCLVAGVINCKTPVIHERFLDVKLSCLSARYKSTFTLLTLLLRCDVKCKQ